MRLTILGCSGSAPGPAAPASGYLLEADGCLLVLDLGNGTLAELQSGRDPFEMDALLLSHLHPDHCADFSALTVFRRYHPKPPHDPRQRRLPVYAPAEAPDRFACAYATSAAERAETDLSDVYDFHALPGGDIRIGPFRVSAVPMRHPTEAYGFRITDGHRVFAYTGDTAVCPELDTLAAGVDLLLAEATWTHGHDRPIDVHLSGKEAGELAARAGIGRLLVTHVPPWANADAVLAEVRAEYPGDARLAERGARYEV
ncbi:MAG: MBL fold metallo-hydrolase [Pseudonocardiaceae bacterium]|nr:MBL fold metallo-hydrolase [Pseudonocardiaceae bacterium]